MNSYNKSSLGKSSIGTNQSSVAVIGIFKNDQDANNAVTNLRNAGFIEEEINIVSKKQRQEKQEGRYYDDDVTDGAFTGSTLGGIGGLIVGAGALAIPGIGPIVAAGPIAAALSGALAGGIAGGLVDWGIPSEASERYENSVAQGNILAIIRTDDMKVTQAAKILRDHGADNVESHKSSQNK